jgi:hypothetical protein
MAPASGTGRADRKFDEGFDTMLSRLSPIFSILVVCVLAVTAVPERAAALAPDAAAKRRRELHRLFVQGFDTRTIGRFVLGRHWDAASEQQLEEYLALFEAFAVQSYAPRLGDYAGNRLQVKEARVLGTNGDIIVSRLAGPRPGRGLQDRRRHRRWRQHAAHPARRVRLGHPRQWRPARRSAHGAPPKDRDLLTAWPVAAAVRKGIAIVVFGFGSPLGAN